MKIVVSHRTTGAPYFVMEPVTGRFRGMKQKTWTYSEPEWELHWLMTAEEACQIDVEASRHKNDPALLNHP